MEQECADDTSGAESASIPSAPSALPPPAPLRLGNRRPSPDAVEPEDTLSPRRRRRQEGHRARAPSDGRAGSVSSRFMSQAGSRPSVGAGARSIAPRGGHTSATRGKVDVRADRRASKVIGSSAAEAHLRGVEARRECEGEARGALGVRARQGRCALVAGAAARSKQATRFRQPYQACSPACEASPALAPGPLPRRSESAGGRARTGGGDGR